jgi:hypothetical protein
VVLTFKPASIHKTETVAYLSYIVLVLAVLLGVYVEYRKKKTMPAENTPNE